ncbi:MAG: hypothetical protein KDB22_00525, partial [Planctomycetales bacterium]|nr:hypothetical protein [Planctomycetales bacterium]
GAMSAATSDFLIGFLIGTDIRMPTATTAAASRRLNLTAAASLAGELRTAIARTCLLKRTHHRRLNRYRND